MLLFYFTKAKGKIQEATLRFNTNHSPTRCFSSFPHIVSARHISPSVYNCFRNAEVVWFLFFFSPSPSWEGKVLWQPRYPAASQYLRDPQTGFVHLTPVILFHLCLKFVSSLLSHHTKTEAWGWLAIVTYQPIFFPLSLSLFLHTNVGEINFFLSRNRIPFVAWGEKKSWTRKWYLCWHGEFPAPEVWGTTRLTVLW